MRAAEQGIGVAFGVFPMTTEWVASGRLAVPLPLRTALTAHISFVYRDNDPHADMLTQLSSWLREQYASLAALPPGRLASGTRGRARASRSSQSTESLPGSFTCPDPRGDPVLVGMEELIPCTRDAHATHAAPARPWISVGIAALATLAVWLVLRSPWLWVLPALLWLGVAFDLIVGSTHGRSRSAAREPCCGLPLARSVS